MNSWYGPPIALAGVPGAVYACGDGDFAGDLRAGWEMSAWDRGEVALRRMKRAIRIATSPKRQRLQLSTGFSSLSDLISEATTGGKRRDFFFAKTGTTGKANLSNSLYYVGPQPAAGAGPAAAPGGTVFDDTVQGAIPFANPAAGDTQHFVSGWASGSVANNQLLLYDLLFGVLKTASSSAQESVTGVPNRYQNTTGGNPDSIDGNFLYVMGGGTLGAVAHNWTVCTYLDHSGNASTLPSLAGTASTVVNQFDQPTYQWFAPLATGDTGIKALTALQCSVATVTGNAWFMIGHPIAWFPLPIANLICPVDGINTAFNLARIFDNAHLSLLEVIKPSTTAASYSMGITTVAG